MISAIRKRAAAFALLLAPAIAPAQDPPEPIHILGTNLTGSLRGRVESWDWFRAPPADGSYTFGSAVLRLSLGRSWKRLEWLVEGSLPVFLNLPDNAVAPDPQGPLGYGGDYFSVNGQRNIAAAVLRQAFVGIKTNSGLQLRAGRFEFGDGTEAVPADAMLAALKGDRIDQRLLATFSYALRSIDGAQVIYRRGRSTFAAVGGRLVEGSFRLRALQEIGVELGYGAYTRSFSEAGTQAETRFFVLYYRDGRGVLKTDNRPAAALAADRRPIQLATPGAHFIATFRAGKGTVDVALWGAAQFGRWGVLDHIAGEVAAEAGYRFSVPAQPWIRFAYFRSTGDADPNDGRHTTFFQALSLPRMYARFPFYVLMNAEDVSLQFKAVPASKLALRSELHSVRLSSARDLWYDGGGAFESASFGYLGRPGGGARKIGESLDLSLEYSFSRNMTASFYGGIGRGDAVPTYVFPAGGARPALHLISVEWMRRF